MWYLAKRGLQMLAILVILSAALFGLLSSMPGNPIDLLITSNPNVKPEDVVRLKKLRGLDKPWYIQYLRWLRGYAEPARAPTIMSFNDLSARVTSDNSFAIDLTPYLVDKNFVPGSEQMESWLNEVWPTWMQSDYYDEMKQAIKDSNIPEVLLLIAKNNGSMQNEVVRKMDRESAKNLSLIGLFGSQADGLTLSQSAIPKDEKYLWFAAVNNYQQGKVGRIPIRRSAKLSDDILAVIDTQIVEDETKPFSLDLKKFLIDPKNAANAKFRLEGKSPGRLSENGVYENLFKKDGQTVVTASVTIGDGPSERFAFDVEHGVVGHESKFNRGFLYVFVGDRGALGFSQTYKRPVYDLLFGVPTLCGDGKVDPGETCDDGNTQSGDGCNESCYKDEDSFLTRADAGISGYIVRAGRIGNTVQLMFPALILSLLIAIPLGVFSAYRQYSAIDYVVNFFAFVGISLPVFWFGIMMMYVFAEAFQILPAGGVQTPGIYGEGSLVIFLDRLKHAVLPTMVLSIFFVGRWLRYMRASMLEVLPKDYIRTARAKGLSERVVILKHAFRNALIPVVTVLALSIPALFGGAVLTETVFSWPGDGRLQYEAVMNSDYYVAIVVFLVSAVLVMLGDLAADALYVLVDPRIRKK